MAENKQNTENKNTAPAAGDNKPSATGSGASAQTAKDDHSTPNKGGQNNPANDAAASAKDTLEQVKESAGAAATQAIGQAKEKAGSVLDEQKTNLASGITSVADSIRQVGENLSQGEDKNQIAALAGKYGDTLAGQVEKFSSYIDDKEITELVGDVEKFARRNPLLFVGGAFALGILAARFLKSSGQNQASAGRARNRSGRENS